MHKVCQAYSKEQAIERMEVFFTGNIQSFCDAKLANACDELSASLEEIITLAEDFESLNKHQEVIKAAELALFDYERLKYSGLSQCHLQTADAIAIADDVIRLAQDGRIDDAYSRIGQALSSMINKGK